MGVGIRPTASSNILDDEEAEAEETPMAACVLIWHDDGRVLGVSRRDDPTAFGLPGGKVDSGETPDEAAARELYEETGLTITDLSLIHQRTSPGEDDYVTYVYTGKVSGEIDTDEEGVVQWVDIQTLLDGPFGEYNRGLFEKLGQL
jgi:8-oxo-dGTP diphosphatase